MSGSESDLEPASCSAAQHRTGEPARVLALLERHLPPTAVARIPVDRWSMRLAPVDRSSTTLGIAGPDFDRTEHRAAGLGLL